MTPVFAFDPRPGSVDFALYVSPAEYRHVTTQGWATLDGIRCTPVLNDCDPTPPNCFLRMRLDQPWQKPHGLKIAA